MNRLELLNKVTNLSSKEILQYKKSHVSNLVRLLVADENNDIYKVTLNDSYGTLLDDKFYFAKQIKNLDGVDVEDVKDLFRENEVTENSCISTKKVGNYNDHFKLWGIDDVKTLIGHDSTSRACVSNFYQVVNAELIFGGQVLKVEYATDFSEAGTETVLYTDFMPVNEVTEKDAEKAMLARKLFGSSVAMDIMNYGHTAAIVTQDELKELSESQRLHYHQWLDSEYYVRLSQLRTAPTGSAIKSIVNQVINDKERYNSKFAEKNNIHQGHLSEMRSGKRDVNNIRFDTIIKIVDGYNDYAQH